MRFDRKRLALFGKNSNIKQANWEWDLQEVLHYGRRDGCFKAGPGNPAEEPRTVRPGIPQKPL